MKGGSASTDAGVLGRPPRRLVRPRAHALVGPGGLPCDRDGPRGGFERLGIDGNREAQRVERELRTAEGGQGPGLRQLQAVVGPVVFGPDGRGQSLQIERHIATRDRALAIELRGELPVLLGQAAIERGIGDDAEVDEAPIGSRSPHGDADGSLLAAQDTTLCVHAGHARVAADPCERSHLGVGREGERLALRDLRRGGANRDRALEAVARTAAAAGSQGEYGDGHEDHERKERASGVHGGLQAPPLAGAGRRCVDLSPDCACPRRGDTPPAPGSVVPC